MFPSTFLDAVWGVFLIAVIFVPLILLWAFALADLFRRKGMPAIGRALWLLIIILLPILGPLIYLLIRPAPRGSRVSLLAISPIEGLVAGRRAPLKRRPHLIGAAQ